jgi:hypothetical protein
MSRLLIFQMNLEIFMRSYSLLVGICLCSVFVYTGCVLIDHMEM